MSVAPSSAAAKSQGTLAGQLLGVTIPPKARGVADVQAIRLDTGVIAGTRRLGASGLYELKLPAGPYVVLATVIDLKARTLRTQTGKALTLGAAQRRPASVKIGAPHGKAKQGSAAYLQRSGKLTPDVKSVEVRDLTGATGKLAFMNRGLTGVLQRAIAGAGAGCDTALIANARQRAAIKGGGSSIARDLVLADVVVGGNLASRAGTLAYRLQVSEPGGGKAPATREGELKLDDRFFTRADALGRDLARAICAKPLAQPEPQPSPPIPPPPSPPNPPPPPPPDTTAPVITLTSPANGGSLSTEIAVFSGLGGAAPGDSYSVTVRAYAGTIAVGVPVQTLTATRGVNGGYSVSSGPLPAGTYTARAEQSDAAGNTGASSANTFTVTPAADDPTMIGAGDIAGCGSTAGDPATAALLAQSPDSIVFTLGDNAYPTGQPSEYATCYQSTWGAQKARTRPITGDHDTATVPGGALPNQGFSEYFATQLAPFGPTASDRLKSYYSYDVGAWHVVALNSPCYRELPGCDPALQEQWFRDDLAAHANACTLVLWHHARWSSGAVNGNVTRVQPLWETAYNAGAEIVLSGNEHDYERFAPQDDKGKLDEDFGVRAFVVGTGGYYLYALRPQGPLPNSEAFASTYGVLKLTLHTASYDWQFIPIAGQAFTDSGTGSCHGAPPA